MHICFSYFYNMLPPDILVNSNRRRYCFLSTVLTRAPLGLNYSHIKLIAPHPVLLSFLCICFSLCLEFISPGLFLLKLFLTWVWAVSTPQPPLTFCYHSLCFHLPDTNPTITQSSLDVSLDTSLDVSLDILRLLGSISLIWIFVRNAEFQTSLPTLTETKNSGVGPWNLCFHKAPGYPSTHSVWEPL